MSLQPPSLSIPVDKAVSQKSVLRLDEWLLNNDEFVSENKVFSAGVSRRDSSMT